MKDWIPIEWRELEEEEKEDYPDWVKILCSKKPDDGDSILVTDGKEVWEDVWCVDDDYNYLDSGADLIEATAWMPLPKPYKGEEQ